jgi:hypothetical protein
MTFARHVVEWRGECYTLQPLTSFSRVTSLSPTWAVLRRGEFIGTLSYRQSESSGELEVRCVNWRPDLLESSRHRER